MKTSGPVPDWIAEVTRGWRSLPLTVSRLILIPSAFIASGSMLLRKSSSDAGTKSFHLIQCTVLCCANPGAWCDASIPASPAPDACRNLRRVKRAICLLLQEVYARTLAEFRTKYAIPSVTEDPRQPERQARKVR